MFPMPIPKTALVFDRRNLLCGGHLGTGFSIVLQNSSPGP
jgi:hypothetical protein